MNILRSKINTLKAKMIPTVEEVYIFVRVCNYGNDINDMFYA